MDFLLWRVLWFLGLGQFYVLFWKTGRQSLKMAFTYSHWSVQTCNMISTANRLRRGSGGWPPEPAAGQVCVAIFSPVVIVSEADSGGHRKLRCKYFPEKSKAMFPKLLSRDAWQHVVTRASILKLGLASTSPFTILWKWLNVRKQATQDFPGGSVVKNLPT